MTTPGESSDDKIVTLKTLPVTINVTQLAAGFLDLFTDEERIILRFGMLPAGKMQILENALNEKFRSAYGLPETGGDSFTATLRLEPNGDFQCIDFSLNELINEAVRVITLALYEIGDLVV